jgi:glycosyltransferase involved in cell wall biosynthesis
MIRVTQFMRRPVPGWYSIERLYEDVRACLPPDILVQVRVSRYYSRGLWGRFYDAVAASRHQGDVNHITGDVHFLTFFLSRRRTVMTVHDCGRLETLRGVRRWVLWFFWFWLPAKRCAAIVAISHATKQQLLRYIRVDPDKVKVIHNNVSSEFQPVPVPFNSVRPRLLQIGVTENKNIERLAAALDGLDCELVVIGQPNPDQQAALKQNAVRFEIRVGLSREELLDEYRRCDMLVFVSTYEGFGLPIVEANAVGRPVITSDLLSMPEVAGDAACLVDPFDVMSIRAGIHRVIDDAQYREELVARGFVNAERFRVESIATQYADLYRKIHQQASGAS